MYWYWVDAAHIKPLSQSTDQTEDKVVVAYVTSWSKVMPDPKYMTHINYAFGHVNETFDGVGIANPERLQQIVRACLKTVRRSAVRHTPPTVLANFMLIIIHLETYFVTDVCRRCSDECFESTGFTDPGMLFRIKETQIRF